MPIKMRLILALIIGAAAGTYVTAMQKDKIIGKEAIRYGDLTLSVTRERLNNSMRVQGLQKQIGVIDAKYSNELRTKEKEVTDLNNCLQSDKCGLRVKIITKPAATTGNGSAGNTCMDSGDTARLDPAVRPDYIALRTGIVHQHAQLEACILSLESITRSKQHEKTK